MANITKDQVIEFISNMSVLEMSDLVKEMEEKFGVSAAAAAVAAPAASSGDTTAPVEEIVIPVTSVPASLVLNCKEPELSAPPLTPTIRA